MTDNSVTTLRWFVECSSSVTPNIRVNRSTARWPVNFQFNYDQSWREHAGSIQWLTCSFALVSRLPYLLHEIIHSSNHSLTQSCDPLGQRHGSREGQGPILQSSIRGLPVNCAAARFRERGVERKWLTKGLFAITAESSCAHWLMFIVNKRTDTWNL